MHDASLPGEIHTREPIACIFVNHLAFQPFSNIFNTPIFAITERCITGTLLGFIQVNTRRWQGLKDDSQFRMSVGPGFTLHHMIRRLAFIAPQWVPMSRSYVYSNCREKLNNHISCDHNIWVNDDKTITRTKVSSDRGQFPKYIGTIWRGILSRRRKEGSCSWHLQSKWAHVYYNKSNVFGGMDFGRTIITFPITLYLAFLPWCSLHDVSWLHQRKPADHRLPWPKSSSSEIVRFCGLSRDPVREEVKTGE